MPAAAHAETENRLSQDFRAGLGGDAAAYRRFLDALSALLRGFLRRRLTAHRDDIEDVLQETLLAIHNGRHTWDATQPLRPWVYAITRYKIVDHVRAKHRRGVDLPLEALDDLLSSADEEPARAGRDLAVLMKALPERQRLAIQYVKLEGLSVSEAAERASISESLVKVSVHRGLKKLAMLCRVADENQ